MAGHATVDGESATGKRLRVLVVRASFSSLGGAERELLTVLRDWGQRWEVTVATLALPKEAQELAAGLKVKWLKPEADLIIPSGGLAEITGKASKVASKAWKSVPGLAETIANVDVAHISVCRGSLEILPLLPSGLGVHYHCLEPPRWLYEDVLHRKIDGRHKRPQWLTNLLFRSQKKADRRLVKQLLRRKGSVISGNSHHIQANLGKFYDLQVNSSLVNGEPPARDTAGRALGPSVLMHVVDLADWSEAADNAEAATELPLTPDSPYVVTVGRLGWVKGAWETVHSLAGTGLGLAQVGGGDAADKALLQSEAKRLGVPYWSMPRLEQAALRKLVRGAVAMVSHAHGEPFGLTPIEAMAVGVPALFVDEGGFHFTMTGADSGKLLPRPLLNTASDHPDMAAWHQAYAQAQDADIRRDWAVAGRKHVEGGFTLEVQALALERLLRNCIEYAN
jgi:glycosyltransferase involved in cell wall biosynthesis